MDDPCHIPEPECILHYKTSTIVIIAYNAEIFKPSIFLLKRLQKKTGIDYKKYIMRIIIVLGRIQ